jgi:hypothetical protein
MVLRRIFGPKKEHRNGENYIMISLMSCTPHQYCSGDQIEKNEVDGTCSAYGGEDRHIQGFGGET